jgi:DNA polymerase
VLVVSLGRYSMARFFPNAKISRVHGQARETEGRLFVPMYHPAAALHQQSLRETILEDFRKLPALIEQGRELRRPIEAATAQGGGSEPPAQIRLFE